MFCELACTWTDEQLQALKDEHRKFAQQENELIVQWKQIETDKTLDKELKIELLRLNKEPIKEVQSHIKAATFLIDFFYGTGKFANGGLAYYKGLPPELNLNFAILLSKLSQDTV